MEGYKTKARRVSGTRYRDVYDEAFSLYEAIRKRTKRRPYIRSVYFRKQKIFVDLFWQHLHDKNWRDRKNLPAQGVCILYFQNKRTKL